MNKLVLNNNLSPDLIFSDLAKQVNGMGFNIVKKDLNRPWGGFFVIDEDQISTFISLFFPELKLSEKRLSQKLSPKFLIVAPEKRLSWQYHHRREEVWKLVAGESAVARSNTDLQTEPEEMRLNELVTLDRGERHRLVGEKTWGVVAEIWMHTDPEKPSDENDIVRLEDDYDRK